MKDLTFLAQGVELPAKAQNLDTIFAFLFNFLDLFTNFLGLVELLRDLFGIGGTPAA